MQKKISAALIFVQFQKEQGIPLFANSDVKEITEKDGKINVVRVLFNQKNEKTIRADAVVVTTGGYGANMDIISKVRPDLVGLVTTNQPGTTGDGIKMIDKLGGTTVDMDQIQVHPTVQQESCHSKTTNTHAHSSSYLVEIRRIEPLAS